MANEADLCERLFEAIRNAHLPTAKELIAQGMLYIFAISIVRVKCLSFVLVKVMPMKLFVALFV
jgi:hypothetical protein